MFTAIKVCEFNILGMYKAIIIHVFLFFTCILLSKVSFSSKKRSREGPTRENSESKLLVKVSCFTVFKTYIQYTPFTTQCSGSTEPYPDSTDLSNTCTVSPYDYHNESTELNYYRKRDIYGIAGKMGHISRLSVSLGHLKCRFQSVPSCCALCKRRSSLVILQPNFHLGSKLEPGCN